MPSICLERPWRRACAQGEYAGERPGPDLGPDLGAYLGDLVVVVLNDRPRLVLEGAEPLADRLDIVVDPAARLAALHQPFLEHLLGAVVHEHAGDLERRAHHRLPSGEVVRVAREAVDEEALAAVRFDRVYKELARDLDGHDAPVADVLVDQRALLRPALALGAKQVARRQMDVSTLVDDPRALRALAGAGATQDEDDGGRLGCLDGGFQHLRPKEAGQLEQAL